MTSFCHDEHAANPRLSKSVFDGAVGDSHYKLEVVLKLSLLPVRSLAA